MVGRKVQHYQFLDKLGSGGMGEIYRAQDTRLNRFVAIKVLTGSSANDPDRRRRFIQEAQAASALNHPNIVILHDILTDEGEQFMVLEHIQGKTLADLIPRGGLRVPQVLKIAMQMTDALQTAHAAGIIHRDLKPGNVMVTDSGLAKVLDFGLAKLADPEAVTRDHDITRTIAEAPLTIEGSIIGTVSYMSPEQAEGKKVDTRSDIFSLGVVLYEMITGNRAFQADTAVGTLSMILRDSPKPISEVAPDVPPRLAQVVDRCLLKSPDDRFQTMKEVHLALGGLKHESDSGVLYRSAMSVPAEVSPSKSASVAHGAPPQATSQRSSNIKWIVGGVVAIVLLGVGSDMVRDGTQSAPNQSAKSAPPATSEEVLTNDHIIQMVQANVPLEVVYNQIRSTPNKFSLSASEVIRLTAAKVPPPVIEAMRDPKNIPSAGAKAAPKMPEATSATPTPVAAATTLLAPAATSEVVLSDGSPFAIALTAGIPENTKTGMQLKFTVVNDVKVGDAVAIAKGAKATGQITHGKRTFGKMTLRFLTVSAVDGKLYKIRALAAGEKIERPVETKIKPKNDKNVVDAGTQYIAYVDGDMHVMVGSK